MQPFLRIMPGLNNCNNSCRSKGLIHFLIRVREAGLISRCNSSLGAIRGRKTTFQEDRLAGFDSLINKNVVTNRINSNFFYNYKYLLPNSWVSKLTYWNSLCCNYINMFFRAALKDLVMFDLGFGFCSSKSPLRQILSSVWLKYIPNIVIRLIMFFC